MFRFLVILFVIKLLLILTPWNLSDKEILTNFITLKGKTFTFSLVSNKL